MISILFDWELLASLIWGLDSSLASPIRSFSSMLNAGYFSLKYWIASRILSSRTDWTLVSVRSRSDFLLTPKCLFRFCEALDWILRMTSFLSKVGSPISSS